MDHTDNSLAPALALTGMEGKSVCSEGTCAAVGAPVLQCAAIDDDCTDDDNCCKSDLEDTSNVCNKDQGTCQACKTAQGACSVDSDCCGSTLTCWSFGRCMAGTEADPKCGMQGKSCVSVPAGSTPKCCGKLFCWPSDGKCHTTRPVIKTCTKLGGACTGDGSPACCGKLKCWAGDGKCHKGDEPPACTKAGGDCTADGAPACCGALTCWSSGVCQAGKEPPACTKVGGDCTADGAPACCGALTCWSSGVCKAGKEPSEPVGACLDAGMACGGDTEADCCDDLTCKRAKVNGKSKWACTTADAYTAAPAYSGW